MDTEVHEVGDIAAVAPAINAYNVAIGMPGPTMCTDTAWALKFDTLGRHRTFPLKSRGTWDNFSLMWGSALNYYEFGEGDFKPGDISHFAMLHGDVAPNDYGWLDILLAEMDAGGYGMVSACVPIKGPEGSLSCGVGDADDPWRPWRRLTLKEVFNELPETFTLDDVLQNIDGVWPENPVLLHNNGCVVMDLRKPAFHVAVPDGMAPAYFQFPKRMYRDTFNGGRWTIDGDSEDWFFSRRAHAAGITSAVTRKVRLQHMDGNVGWDNHSPWGQWEHDEAWRKNWELPKEANEEVRDEPEAVEAA